MSFLENVSSFAGYKLNLEKSECFPINTAASDLPFQFGFSGFKYLGIYVTRSISNLMSANFTPLISNITSDIQRWGTLPPSLIGRINTVKTQTAHIHKLWYWFKSPGSSCCKLELSSCRGSSISALLYSSLPTKLYIYTDNQVVLNTLKIWYQFRHHFKFVAVSSLDPVNNRI